MAKRKGQREESFDLKQEMLDTGRLLIGRSILKARKAKRLAQSDVAADCGFSGVYLSQIEKGKTLPSLGNLIELSWALGVPTSELLASVDSYFAPVVAGLVTEDR